MSEILVVANWKSNKSAEDAKNWLTEFSQLAKSVNPSRPVKVVICPPFIDLPYLSWALTTLKVPFPVELGAQNVSPYGEGSFTGEVSAAQLTGLVNYCLVGHSERRINFHETNQEIYSKINNLVTNKISPILCAQNLEEIPQEVGKLPAQEILVMFEPAKAISSEGVYKAESPQTVKETVSLWQEKIGEYRYLYGGSVNENNCRELLDSGIKGFVVGHASLSPSSFLGIIKNV
ncbi:triosephosphate isomerase [Candidatus Microgenomates bacterium]|nr:triosephosphate isomerase [Candidatus Microgenomates bacterium]